MDKNFSQKLLVICVEIVAASLAVAALAYLFTRMYK